MKQKIIFLVSVGVLAIASVAQAQLFTYTATDTMATTTATTTMMMSTTTATTTMMAATTTMATTTALPSVPTYVVAPAMVATGNPGFFEMDNLVVNSISDSAITARTADVSTCVSYATADATVGATATCPISSSDSYNITFNAATQWLLSDRMPAVIADFAPGDSINVFGFYDGAGNIQASIIRDLSSLGVNGSGSTTMTTSNASLYTTLQDIVQAVQGITDEGSDASSTFVTSGQLNEVEGIITALQNIITQLSGGTMTSTSTMNISVSTSSGAPMILAPTLN